MVNEKHSIRSQFQISNGGELISQVHNLNNPRLNSHLTGNQDPNSADQQPQMPIVVNTVAAVNQTEKEPSGTIAKNLTYPVSVNSANYIDASQSQSEVHASTTVYRKSSCNQRRQTLEYLERDKISVKICFV